MKRRTKTAVLLLFFAMALALTMAFTNNTPGHVKGFAINWPLATNELVISCGPGASIRSGTFLNRKAMERDRDNGHESANASRQSKNSNGNGCSHQPIPGSFCEISSEKRRNQKNS